MNRTQKTHKVVALLTKELKEWIQSYSAKTGLAESAIVTIALMELRAKQ